MRRLWLVRRERWETGRARARVPRAVHEAQCARRNWREGS